jgi:NADPH:quinone reductase-like Zn-dependent oxidoreductase
MIDRMRTASMAAVVAPEPGPPEVLELREVPRPVPGPGEVLIRTTAIGVNPVDAKTRAGGGAAGLLDGAPHPGHPDADGADAFPWIPGWDVAGVVEEAGWGVVRFAPGDRVFGMVGFPRRADGYAEYVVAPQSQLSRSPRSLSDEETVALALPGLTAWQALVDAGGLEANQRLLVLAAAGGVGHLAVQIGVDLGAEVIAVGSPGNLEFLRDLGASEVLDRTAIDDLASATAPVDLVLDGVGGDARAQAFAVAKPGGVVATLPSNSWAGPAPRDDVRAPQVFVVPDGLELQLLTGTVERGMLKPHVADVLPLAEAAEAHRRIASGTVRGKLVLRP